MKVDAILTADLHLRDSIPVARTDDFLAAQIKKVKFIQELSKKYKCPTFIAGDIFDKAKSSPYVESLTLLYLPDNAIVIPGNHCMPSHNINNLGESSLGVLEAAKKVIVLYGANNEYIDENNFPNIRIAGFPFGDEVKSIDKEGFKIALVHQMIHKDKAIHKSIKSTSGQTLLDKTNFDLIVCGDNHQPFTVKHKGRLLVNCGSLMRTTAGQIDYEPVVWLWNKENNEVQPVKIPIEKGVISREHIDKKEKEDVRINAFVKGLNTDYEIERYFEKNLESYFKKNKTRTGVKKEIYESMER